jgi:CHAD domain-containing protein
MRLETPVLDFPHHQGARLVVRSLLGDAERELSNLEARAGEEALHDFRVAVRRLRSLVRALRPSLAGAVRRKHERLLKSVANATSAARDAEVQIAWLARERPQVSARDAAAVDWLVERLAQRQRAGYEEASADLSGRFRALSRKLVRALGKPIEVERDPAGPPSLGEVLAEIVRSQAVDLLSGLEAVSGPFDVERAHAARIAGKRLRYALEPLRGNPRADSSAAVSHLKDLQDILGELHDAHVLGEILAAALVEVATDRARRAHASILAGGPGGRALRIASRDAVTRGLLVLDGRVAERATAAHAALRDWNVARREALLREVTAIGDALSPRTAGRPGASRRFLLLRLPDGVHAEPDLELEQGFLPGSTPRGWLLRVRGPSGTRWLRGSGESLEREAIAEHQFLALWPTTEGARLARHRHLVVRGGRRWTVDVVGDKGPVIAETAVPGGDELELPGWIRRVLVREVSAERAYDDERLATKLSHPRPVALRAVPDAAEPEQEADSSEKTSDPGPGVDGA